MRRHDYQLATSGREDARKERRRFRHPELYRDEEEFSDVDNVVVICPAHHGCASATETDNRSLSAPPVEPASTKIVYLETKKVLLQDLLQSTWGRIQQQEEIEYERIVELFTRLRKTRTPTQGRNILEAFEGFVDQFAGAIAYVTIKTGSGEKIYGEYPAVELKVKGIRERGRFRCWTVEVGNSVEFVMEPLPDQEISEDRERQIDEWLQKSLGDDDAPQND